MNDSATKPTATEPAATGSDIPTLSPVTVFAALGSEVRWPMVKLLADGRARSISEIRAVAGSTAENISKQLRVLMVAGILENRPGEDRRQSVFSIPAAYRTTPGGLDFGFCVVKVKS
jgi:predicted transcriptional regulator